MYVQNALLRTVVAPLSEATARQDAYMNEGSLLLDSDTEEGRNWGRDLVSSHGGANP